MKSALLITAYKDLEQLVRLVDFFDEDFDVYLHIDASCREATPQFSRGCGGGLHVERTYAVRWGSEKHLWAIDSLLRKAVAHGPYACYHLITGSDYPIKPLAEFKRFFAEGKGLSYMEWHPMPRPGWPGNGGMDRVRHYWVGNQWVDSRKAMPAYTRALLWLQRKLHFSRGSHGFARWYGGGTYFSLTQEAAEVLCATSQSRLHRWTRFTHCAEEVYPHTMLLNALHEDAVCNDSLRFMLWDEGSTGPRVLTEADFPALAASHCFFARKLEPGVSDALKQKIDDELLER